VFEMPKADVLRIFDDVNESYATRFNNELAALHNGDLVGAKEPAFSA